MTPGARSDGGDPSGTSPRILLVVFGDQLDPSIPSHLGLDPTRDALWMAEVDEEITYVPSHKRRIALFLSAMRHYRDARLSEGFTVHYHALTRDPGVDRGSGFDALLRGRPPLHPASPPEVVARPRDASCARSVPRPVAVSRGAGLPCR